jgi:hypothetical protein
MEKQKEREKPQAKKHGPNQWRMNYKGMFGQAKTPELAYLRLVEVLHERLERSFEIENFRNAETKALELSLKECEEKQTRGYYDLLSDFRVQHETLENFVSERESAQAYMKENSRYRDKVLELRATIEDMKKQIATPPQQWV